jgi:hypothetical protein
MMAGRRPAVCSLLNKPTHDCPAVRWRARPDVFASNLMALEGKGYARGEKSGRSMS